MSEHQAILFIDRGWTMAAHMRLQLVPFARFNKVITVRAPLREAQSTDGAHTYANETPPDLCLWIGTALCGLAPGGLILSVKELPRVLHQATSLLIEREAKDAYTLLLTKADGRAYNYPLMCTAATQDGTILEMGGTGGRALPSRQYVQVAERVFALEGHNDSPFMHGRSSTKQLHGSAHDMLAVAGRELCAMLASLRAHPDNLERYLSSLIGLGVGLTPSGDDFLVGVLAVVKAFGLNPLMENRMNEVIERLSEKTSTISREYLIAAVQGRFSRSVIDVVNTMSAYPEHTSATQIEAALRALFSHGSTSGTDSAAGIIEMMRAYQAQRRPTTFSKEIEFTSF